MSLPIKIDFPFISSLFKVLLITFFISCTDPPEHLERVSAMKIPIDSSLATDSSINAFIRPYRFRLNEALNEVLAYSPSAMTKTDTPYNTAIGNLLVEIVYERGNPVFKSRSGGKDIDIVLLNFGGIRSSIPAGNLTRRTAYEIIPFENEIVVVELTAEQVQEMIKYLHREKIAHPLRGLTLDFNEGSGIVTAYFKGKNINEKKTYYIATSDYLQAGGDEMKFLTQPVSIVPLNYKIRNAIIDYFIAHDTITAQADQRFIIKK